MNNEIVFILESKILNVFVKITPQPKIIFKYHFIGVFRVQVGLFRFHIFIKYGIVT